MKKIAAIDIGTNTALFLLAELTQSGEIHPHLQKEQIVRLGEGVDKSKILKRQAIARVLTSIEEYIAIGNDWGVEEILISGTSAVRDAENRQDLINAIKKKFGIELQVLTGAEEARLTYFGALSNKPELQGEILLIDIGGGSTEFISGTQQKLKYATSLDIGSVRFTERFVKNDPITSSEFSELQSFISNRLTASMNELTFRPAHFIGVAGTITTLAAMHLKMRAYDPSRIEHFVLKLKQVKEIVSDLRMKTLAERKEIPGLNSKRADVILAGSLILLESMQLLNCSEIVVSDRGLRFGLLLKALGGK